MTTKQYLNQAYKMDDSIKCDIRKLDQLKEMLYSISASPTTQDRVQTSSTGDRVSKSIVKIIDMENHIDTLVDNYIDKCNEIQESIAQLDNVNERLVLKYRHIQFEKWDNIARHMGYSRQNVHKIYKRALKNFEEKQKSLH